MNIKRVDILGFKSFVDKVSLDFQQPVTGVVGPNGCGKSNIVDAIRWAMGEQNARNLRGRAMEDIIFGGSESRRPHGMAEVSIIFDNSAKLCPENYRDYAEIMVTRRLYRNGESEYLINKTPCRLLDITELFMDTGVGARAYSIIEQGKIGMLVSARPEERRALIEEAAGVTKFKSRKKTAERKMDATRQNLVRLGDIISEVRRQTGSLKRQAQQAERYRELRGEAKRIEICMAGNRFKVLQAELHKLEEGLAGQIEQLGGAESRLEAGELNLEEKRLQLLRVEDELSRKQEQDYSLGAEVQRVETEIVLAGRQAASLREQALGMEAEQHQIDERLSQLEAESEELERSSRQISSELENTTEAVEIQQEVLQQRLATEQELATRIEIQRRELMGLLSDAGRLANRQEEIVRRLTSEGERQSRNQREALGQQEELSALELKLASVSAAAIDLAELEAVQQESREQLAETILQLKGEQLSLEGELLEKRQVLEKQRSRLESLEELERNLDGYAEGVQALFGAQPELPQRMAADLLQADPAYETLIEIALGERLQAVPVQDLVQARDLLAALTRCEARAALLYPVAEVAVGSLGFGRPLIELVEPLPGYEGFVVSLLAGCYLVDDVMVHLQDALLPGTLLIDSVGRCLGWRGDLSGGATTMAGAGLLRKKREIGELEVRVVELERQLALQQQKVYEQQQQRDELEAALRQLDLLLQQQALTRLELQKDTDRLNHEQLRIRERLELLAFEASQLNDEKQQLLAEQLEISQRRQNFEERQSQLQGETEQHQMLQVEARDAVEEIRDYLTVLKVRLAEFRQQHEGGQAARQRLAENRTEYQQRLALLAARTTDGVAQAAQLLQTEEKYRVELGLLIARREAIQLDVRRARELFENGRAILEQQHENYRLLRTEVEKMRREVSQQQLRQKELTGEIDHLLGGVAEKFDVDLTEHQVAEADDEELERLRLQVLQLQQKIALLGEVNLTAIDEYRELEARYEFLGRQRDDLNQSLDDLQKAISKINRTTRRRFKETFDLVNEQFKLVFPRLFRGGQAELRLTDEEDLLETGIDIIVQPPGKRLQSVNLLSGGEKALTAVAIIFSIFLIKPTPFCLLDEVDAPLDDANIDRFAEMVAEMSTNSQFIIITHSKRTMAAADIMHGITMQEPGVSKLVSVRVNDYLPESAPALS
ncbi:chromosome segregation protein SMC [Geopsychrobacter electrodiphilus]|uniref:chromosome segregation protein SMC n=1 Tax=Geopsychrobacter electrodiphilus TaxID=225196 RepID=UPI0003749D7E|nr:chromosome segregation protein SMC [Geopsychrobacter electrodiphilus]